MRKCLVTGADGFLGRNLVLSLEQVGMSVLSYHHTDGEEVLESYCRECSFVFHLAGVNRPERTEDYELGNVEFTRKLVEILVKVGNACPVIFSSSIQAEQENPYGVSKRRAEELLFEYGERTNAAIGIYRLPNVFGKWCRPNYNSVIATFCHNEARQIPLVVNDASRSLQLVYVDDVVEDFLHLLKGGVNGGGGYKDVPVTYQRTVGEIASLVRFFGDCRQKLCVPEMDDDFTSKLYSTYLSYLPSNKLSYPLLMHEDDRGSFTEFMRTSGQGQFSVNISHPHIVKGNHWHHTKHEKFLVVKGEGIIRLRKVGEREIASYPVSARKLEVVEIPPGYTHSIENTGEEDMVTLMWANENFSPERPDTWPLEV